MALRFECQQSESCCFVHLQVAFCFSFLVSGMTILECKFIFQNYYICWLLKWPIQKVKYSRKGVGSNIEVQEPFRMAFLGTQNITKIMLLASTSKHSRVLQA